jgi:catechol 2,3-dioxygenase-like lactoylglutathione lyase family enzyme
MSPGARRAAVAPPFAGVIPIFPVRDLGASVAYLVAILGFKADFVEAIASVSRGRCAVFLVEGDQGHAGTWAWVGVDDVAAVHEEYLASGARIRQPPTNFPWAREMQVEDLDGNVLRLGSEPVAGQPFGPWRDMHGGLWDHAAQGRWVRR